MNTKARLAKLQNLAKSVERHTCGRLLVVRGDEELPKIPHCAICEREGRLRFMRFRRAPDESETAPALDH